jgi:hypothetical protein
MILIAVMGWALLAGADPRRLVILGVTLAVPWTLLPLIAWSYIRPASRQPRPAMFCEAVASELRSGATLTQALVAAGRASGLDALVELHRRGATARDMGRAPVVEFGGIGRELAVAVDATSRSGAPSAELFDETSAAIWSEISGSRARPVNVFRRNLQRAHTDHLIQLMLRASPAVPEDARSLARLHLKRIRDRVEAALPERPGRCHPSAPGRDEGADRAGTERAHELRAEELTGGPRVPNQRRRYSRIEPLRQRGRSPPDTPPRDALDPVGMTLSGERGAPSR